jgi:hypothetical protein
MRCGKEETGDVNLPPIEVREQKAASAYAKARLKWFCLSRLCLAKLIIKPAPIRAIKIK